ncbi:Cell surface GPI-anchored protein ECM33 [Candida viswanathii]|uniref:Cell surface GPI-anchored protein ECM33 n=1 Tax=Candida viswanathii TaxID=5486 RepID=A0A367YG36_9ASCO|nr:Cell surface GPI-anchored protein ECM33 [Candida viswanathii]
MQIKSFLLPLVAALLADAASSSADKCSFSKTSITEATAIEQLNACETLDGTITVTGNSIGAINLSSVKQLKGNFSIINTPSVISLNLNQLQNITGALVVNNATQLNSVDLTSLSDANEIQLVSLPSFAILNLNTGVDSAGTIVLSDTALTNLNGLSLFKTISTININNNKNITEINFENLETVTDSMILSFNHDDASVNLDTLLWAANLTIQDVEDFSAANLTSVNGSFGFSYNTFDKLELPQLTEVGSSIQVFGHDSLQQLSLPKLTTIGGEIRLFNNTELEDIEFKNLTTVRGALSITGGYSNLTMPKLNLVAGDFTANSTSEDFDCSEFDELHDDDKIKGHNYECAHPTKKEASESGSKTATSGGSKSTGKSDSGSGSGSSADSSSNSSSSSKKNDAAVMAPGFLLAGALGAAIALI